MQWVVYKASVCRFLVNARQLSKFSLSSAIQPAATILNTSSTAIFQHTYCFPRSANFSILNRAVFSDNIALLGTTSYINKQSTMGDSVSTPENYIDKYACDVNDMQDGEMREILMEEEGNKKVLLVRNEGEYFAMGPKCTHFGAPLIKGSLRNGHVRCPWHGACFNIKTGDIEDYPGLDCVPSYKVFVQDGNKVYIRAEKEALKSHKRVKTMVTPDATEGPHYLVIGGGPASVTCVETLRQKSFLGKITIATMEKHVPYDR